MGHSPMPGCEGAHDGYCLQAVGPDPDAFSPPADMVDLTDRVSVDPLQVTGLEGYSTNMTIVHLMGSTIAVPLPIGKVREVLRGQA